MNQHPDDLAVDKFAAAMKEKLAQARAKGRCGWEECAPADLSAMLYEHVAKGDPRDVANFGMFLWNLGQPITQCHKALDVAVQVTDEMAYSFHRALNDSALNADDVEQIQTGLRAALANVPAAAINEQTLSELKNMVRAYVRLLEAGKDRIQSLGGDCDPVDRMEAGDSNLTTAKAAIAAAEAERAKGGE